MYIVHTHVLSIDIVHNTINNHSQTVLSIMKSSSIYVSAIYIYMCVHTLPINN